jgi:hypothetical protein
MGQDVEITVRPVRKQLGEMSCRGERRLGRLRDVQIKVKIFSPSAASRAPFGSAQGRLLRTPRKLRQPQFFPRFFLPY